MLNRVGNVQQKLGKLNRVFLSTGANKANGPNDKNAPKTASYTRVTPGSNNSKNSNSNSNFSASQSSSVFRRSQEVKGAMKSFFEENANCTKAQQETASVPQPQQIIIQQQTVVNVPMTIIPTQEYQDLLKINKELKEKVILLESNNNVLRITMDEIDLCIDTLKRENEMLKAKISELERKLANLESRLVELESRDSPNTVREAMRVLESHICLAIVGSKSKMKMNKLYNLANINGDPTLKVRKEEIMAFLGIEEKHLNMLAFLNDEGDNSAHDNRPVYSRTEWETVIIDEDEDEEEEKTIKLKLLKCLEHYLEHTRTFYDIKY